MAAPEVQGRQEEKRVQFPSGGQSYRIGCVELFFLSETLEGPAGFTTGGAFVYLCKTTVHATTTP